MTCPIAESFRRRNHDSPIITSTFSTASTHLRHEWLKTFAAQKAQSVLRQSVISSRRLHGHDPPREGRMAIHIRRRELIVALGGVAAWPLAARAQQPAMPVIGFLDSRSPDALTDRLREFRRGLKENPRDEFR